MKIQIAALTLALALASGAVLAQTSGTSTPRIDQRQENQDKRIDQGVKSGELNQKEAARLEKGQARVDKMENKAAADGKVTGERAPQDRARAGQAKQENLPREARQASAEVSAGFMHYAAGASRPFFCAHRLQYRAFACRFSNTARLLNLRERSDDGHPESRNERHARVGSHRAAHHDARRVQGVLDAVDVSLRRNGIAKARGAAPQTGSGTGRPHGQPSGTWRRRRSARWSARRPSSPKSTAAGSLST